MTEKMLAGCLQELGIQSVFGVPDSTLRSFCDHLQTATAFQHLTAPNEGAAVGMAVGAYLASGRPACVYLQNSGLGNMVNPYTSLVHNDVYGIPMLFIVGWRGDDTGHDEPQHKFMGRITKELLEVLEIPYTIFDCETASEDLDRAMALAKAAFAQNKAYAFVVHRGTFNGDTKPYTNEHPFCREEAIAALIDRTDLRDAIVSTTGKISREVYETLQKMPARRGQAFLTVGGMGFASSIALAIALQEPGKRVFCLDGDGAVLMHMGALATIGYAKPANLIHVCFNNQAHESVGGMPTGAPQMRYADVAQRSGYACAVFCDDRQSFLDALADMAATAGPCFLEVGVAIGSRKDLGRPKETAAENKRLFMEYHWPNR